MPNGFKFGMGDMVPLMGGHAWNFDNQPNADTKPWEEPVNLMGNYDGEMVSGHNFVNERTRIAHENILLHCMIGLVD